MEFLQYQVMTRKGPRFKDCLIKPDSERYLTGPARCAVLQIQQKKGGK